MATVTNCDLGSVVLDEGVIRDENIYFSGADTYAEGTIMARRAVVTAITPSAITGTGNGTCTAASVVAGPEVPLVGSYVLTCTLAVTHGGIFKLVDPNGKLVAPYLAMTASTGAATVFEVAGLTFTLTDGSTDFVAGDYFALPVVADGKMEPYAIAGIGGTQYPIGVMSYALTATGSGTKRGRVLFSGTVNKKRLIVDADGDDSNITNAILDQLRAAGVDAVDVTQQSVLDNQT